MNIPSGWNLIPDKKIYSSLRPLHCVDWSVMGKEMRDEVYQKVIVLFQTSFSSDEIDFMPHLKVVSTIHTETPKKRSIRFGF